MLLLYNVIIIIVIIMTKIFNKVPEFSMHVHTFLLNFMCIVI